MSWRDMVIWTICIAIAAGGCWHMIHERSSSSIIFFLFFLGCSAGILLMFRDSRRADNQLKWLNTGCCVFCGYDLRDKGGCCPECGRDQDSFDPNLS